MKAKFTPATTQNQYFGIVLTFQSRKMGMKNFSHKAKQFPNKRKNQNKEHVVLQQIFKRKELKEM